MTLSISPHIRSHMSLSAPWGCHSSRVKGQGSSWEEAPHYSCVDLCPCSGRMLPYMELQSETDCEFRPFWHGSQVSRCWLWPVYSLASITPCKGSVICCLLHSSYRQEHSPWRTYFCVHFRNYNDFKVILIYNAWNSVTGDRTNL